MANHDYVLPYTDEFAEGLPKHGLACPPVRPGNRFPTTGELKVVLRGLSDLDVTFPEKGDYFRIHLSDGEWDSADIDGFDWSNDNALPNEDLEHPSFRMRGPIEVELSILKSIAAICGQLVFYPDTGDPPVVVDQDLDVGRVAGVWTWASQPKQKDCWKRFSEFTAPGAPYPPPAAIDWSSPVILYSATQIAERETAAAALQKLSWFKQPLPLLFKMESEYLIHLDKTYVTDKDLIHLPKLHGLVNLNLNEKITDQGLPHVGQVKTLKWLSFKDSQISDHGLVHLSELTNLTFLELRCPLVTGVGFGALARLPRLGHLYLEDTPISDAGIEHLAQFPRLVHLSLSNTDISDAGLQRLANLPRLESLNILDKSITDQRLANLFGLTRLKSLSLQQTQVTEDGKQKMKKALPDTNI